MCPVKNAIALSPTSARCERDWFGFAWKSVAWALLPGSILYYVRRDALHYLFNYSSEGFKGFWSERILHPHACHLCGDDDLYGYFSVVDRPSHALHGFPHLAWASLFVDRSVRGLFWLAAAAMASTRSESETCKPIKSG
jgi:hypothetical protein